MVARFNNSGSMKRQKASHNKLGMKLARKPKGRHQRAVGHNEKKFAAREGTIGQRTAVPKEDTMEVVAVAPAPGPAPKTAAPKGAKKK